MKCRRCDRPLKNPKWQAIGYGPVCARLLNIPIPSTPRASSAGSSSISRVGGTKPSKPLPILEAASDIVLTRAADGTASANVPHALVRHSPTGFEWGYAGSGPAELALNILIKFGCSEAEAWELHQEFKVAFIASMPEQGGTIPAETIKAWLAGKRAERQ